MSDLNLYQRLLEVGKELGWIKKNGENKQQGYEFVRAVDVMDAARDALSKHGVLWTFQTPSYDVVEVNGKIVHKMYGDYSLINVDKPDEILTGRVAGSSIPPGDKGAWVTTTGLLKYALIQLFLLPTGDDPENDENEEKGPPPERKASAPTGAVQRPTPSSVKTGISESQRKLLHAKLESRGVTIDASKKWFNHKVTGKPTTKQWTIDDFDKVIKLLETKDEESEALVVEALAHASDK